MNLSHFNDDINATSDQVTNTTSNVYFENVNVTSEIFVNTLTASVIFAEGYNIGVTPSNSIIGFNLTQITWDGDALNSTIDARSSTSNFSFNPIVGFTSGTYDGNISNGSLIGYNAANAICATEIPGSHFCLKSEVLKGIANGNASITGTYWFQNGPPGFTANADDCVGWTSNDNTFLGPFWNWDVNAQAGAGRLTNCAQLKQLMCCGS